MTEDGGQQRERESQVKVREVLEKLDPVRSQIGITKLIAVSLPVFNHHTLGDATTRDRDTARASASGANPDFC